MVRLVALLLLLPALSSVAQVVTTDDGRIGIGTLEPAPGSIFDVDSDHLGFLLPRLTRSEIEAMNADTETSLEKGLMVYSKDACALQVYDGNSWSTVLTEEAADGMFWRLDGNYQVAGNDHFIGTRDPEAFEIRVGSDNAGPNTGWGRAVRVDPHPQSPRITLGHPLNISGGAGAVILGGGGTNWPQWVAGPNAVDGDFSLVAGGTGQTVNGSASGVISGISNAVDGDLSSVLGGQFNEYHGSFGTILGGAGLQLHGTSSFGFQGTPESDSQTEPYPDGQSLIHVEVNASRTGYFGNVDLWLGNTDDRAREMRFYGPNPNATEFPAGTRYSAFRAGQQTFDITYTLPTTAPNSGDVLTSSNAGSLAWAALPGAWLLDGNTGTAAGTNFLGTLDDEPFEIHVYDNGLPITPDAGYGRVAAFYPHPTSPSIAFGHRANVAADAEGATIGGGGSDAAPNLIDIGAEFGTIAGGHGNTVGGDAPSSTIGGGFANQVGSGFSSVLGGRNNRALGFAGSIGGGQWNAVRFGQYSAISGGRTNRILRAHDAFLGGGRNNLIEPALAASDPTARSEGAVIAGGIENMVGEDFAAIVGGTGNSVESRFGFIGGGERNQVSSRHGAVLGGQGNRVRLRSDGSSIVGGRRNRIQRHDNGFIGGGEGNLLDAPAEERYTGSAIVGGTNNAVVAGSSTILGGKNTTLHDSGSLAFHTGDPISFDDRNAFFLGNTELWVTNNDGVARSIRFYEPNSEIGPFPPLGTGTEHFTSFEAGPQGSDIRYVLPSNLNPLPFLSDGVLQVDEVTGQMSWLSIEELIDHSWKVSGNEDTNPGNDFLGTIDDEAFEIHVYDDNAGLGEGAGRVARFEPTSGGGSSPNLLFGYYENDLDDPGTIGGTIGGGGAQNEPNIVGDFGTVGGGKRNNATGSYSTVGGGESNVAGRSHSVVTGGARNSVYGNKSVIVAGESNITSGDYTVISGGLSNSSSGKLSVIAGGERHKASGEGSAISGGRRNTNSGRYSTIGGGEENDVSGIRSVIAGGYKNTTNGTGMVVCGGEDNLAGGSHAVISGGLSNQTSGSYSAILGGRGLRLENASGSIGFLGGNLDGTHGMTVVEPNIALFGNTDLWLAANDGAPSRLVFFSDYSTAGAYPKGTHHVSLEAPLGLAQSTRYVLPSNDGANGQILATNGNGELSWAAGPIGVQSFAGTTSPVLSLEQTSSTNDGVALEVIDGAVVLSSSTYTAGPTATAPVIADDVAVAVVNQATSGAAGDDVMLPATDRLGQILHVVNTSGFSVNVTGGLGGPSTVSNGEGITVVGTGSGWVILP